jgi:iron-sulfur cluster insertion protein
MEHTSVPSPAPLSAPQPAPPGSVTGGLRLTPAAARRVQALQARKGNPALMLRLTVDGGGCSGFQYRFGFDDQLQPDDQTFSSHGVTVVSDPVSLELLAGAEIDYTESLIGAAFRITNPNASGGCGCGASFSV